LTEEACISSLTEIMEDRDDGARARSFGGLFSLVTLAVIGPRKRSLSEMFGDGNERDFQNT